MKIITFLVGPILSVGFAGFFCVDCNAAGNPEIPTGILEISTSSGDASDYSSGDYAKSDYCSDKFCGAAFEWPAEGPEFKDRLLMERVLNYVTLFAGKEICLEYLLQGEKIFGFDFSQSAIKKMADLNLQTMKVDGNFLADANQGHIILTQTKDVAREGARLDFYIRLASEMGKTILHCALHNGARRDWEWGGEVPLEKKDDIVYIFRLIFLSIYQRIE